MKDNLLKGLTEEQIAKLEACKNQEEMLELAKKEGIELTDEQLAAVSGGCNNSHGRACPDCYSKDYDRIRKLGESGLSEWHCNHCGNNWIN